MPSSSDITLFLDLLNKFGIPAGVLIGLFIAALKGLIVFRPHVDFLRSQFDVAVKNGERATDLAERSHDLAEQILGRLIENNQQQQQLLEVQRTIQQQAFETQRLLQQVQLELARFR